MRSENMAVLLPALRHKPPPYVFVCFTNMKQQDEGKKLSRRQTEMNHYCKSDHTKREDGSGG